MTPADRLREKAQRLRDVYGVTVREAVLLDLLADYVEAVDDAGCDTELRPIPGVLGYPTTGADSNCFERVHKTGCVRCSLLARIEEIA